MWLFMCYSFPLGIMDMPQLGLTQLMEIKTSLLLPWLRGLPQGDIQ